MPVGKRCARQEEQNAMLSVIRLSVLSDVVFLGSLLRTGSRPAAGCNTSVTVSRTLSAEIPSYL